MLEFLLLKRGSDADAVKFCETFENTFLENLRKTASLRANVSDPSQSLLFSAPVLVDMFHMF